jgi:glycosyltransferase involved in cell wall biosynthesis
MPSISVLMPVWNCGGSKEPFLRMAMQSMLDQTYADWEMVIVDDGSSDNTPRILAEYNDSRIKILRNETNLKIVRALNRGIQACNAPLIARMDADDISTVTRLEVQKKFMDERPDTAMCGTSMYVINAEGKLEFEAAKPSSYEEIKAFLKIGCPFAHGSVMYRREVIQALGGYSDRPEYEYAEDYELWVRMAARYRVENIPGRTLYYHRNHGSTSSYVFRQQQERATASIMANAQRMLA